VKTTFLVRDGLCQVVLHPETKAERAVLDVVGGVDDEMSVEVHRAQFSESQAGYVRDYSRFRDDPFAAGAHLPDLVLVLRPVEVSSVQVDLSVPDLSPPPSDVVLCKRSDGTWIYRDYARLWHECPAPDGGWVPPDDVNTYFRKTQDDTWQVYTRDTRAWFPSTGVPEFDQTYEVEQLRADLRAVNDLATQATDATANGVLSKIRGICDDALGRKP
jgi:hypothetical protein